MSSKNKATEGKHETQENIEAEQGYYDEDGFYILVDEEGKDRGDFYDPNGFYFDEMGYDQFGGYYDDDLNYIPGEEYAEEYYRRLYEEEEKEKEKERLYREAIHLETFANHINPVIAHINKQPAGTKFIVRIENVY